ncbi:hypothetical protein Chor_011547, partial [Crotalus horridus]
NEIQHCAKEETIGKISIVICQLLLQQMKLFFILLLSQFSCAMMQMKCLFEAITEEFKEFEEFNYYKPGDYLITGITSKIIAAFYPHIFSLPPTHRLRSYIVAHNLTVKCLTIFLI